jgi:integrase
MLLSGLGFRAILRPVPRTITLLNKGIVASFGVMLHPELEDAWHDFRRSRLRKGRSEHTIEIYRKSYDDFWRWAQTADIPPDPTKIHHTDVNAWVDSMLERPATRGGRVQYETDPETGKRRPRKVLASTIRIRWQNLRPFFSWWAAEMDTPNPFDRADPPRLEDSPVDVVPLSDIRMVLHACDGKDFDARRDTALIRLLIDTGARVGELVAMTVDSWDRRADVVTLTGKTGTRTVPVSPSTGEALSRYLRARKDHPQRDLRAMWLGLRGKLTAGGIAQMIYRRCDQAGVPRAHPHAFRHTWAHEARVAGMAEGDLMVLGGWTTPAMVHRYGRSAAVSRAHDAARSINLGDRL